MTRRAGARGRLRGRLRRRARRAAARRGARPADLDTLARRGLELMVERVRETLERFRVRFDRVLLRAHPARERRGRAGARRSSRGAGHVYALRGRDWLRTTAFGDDKDRVLRRSSGELTYFASDIAYHQDKRGARLRPPDQRAGRRPPRLHRRACKAPFAALGEPEPARGDHHAARPRRRARRAREDVQAQRRLRHARRAARRHRRRRGALLHARAIPRHDARPRSRPGARAQPGEPGLLRAVRARADREHPAQRRRGAGRSARAAADLGRGHRAARARRAGARQAPARAPRGGARGGRAPRAAPPDRLRARRSRPTSTPSTATAAWSARSPPSSRTSASCSPTHARA